MKLGIDVSWIAEDRRGMGRYVRSLLPIMLADYPENEYTLFHRKKFPENQISHALDEIGLARDKYALCRADRCAWSKTDLVWYPWARIDFAMTEAAKAITIHDVADIELAHGSFLMQMNLRKRIAGYIAKSDIVITDSEFSKREIIKHLKIEEEKIKVIYLGTNLQKHSEDMAAGDDISELTEALSSEFIFHVSSNEPRKNVRCLLEAFYEYKKKSGDATKLVLAGANHDPLATYPQLADEPKVLGDIIVPGQVSDYELGELYKKAKAFAFPSTYEGFGLPILEAMSFGCPVITSDAASLPEIGGQAVLYFRPDDARQLASHIEHCVHDTDLREKLSSDGLEQARQFTWKKTASALIEVFTEHIKIKSDE